VTNEELIEAVMDRNRKHLGPEDLRLVETSMRRSFKVSGTEIRYHRENSERAIDLGLRAGRDALHAASLDPTKVDLLIYAGVGRGWIEPAMANLFQSELHLHQATCFDVLDACASWLRSLFIAQSFIDSGIYKRVMLLNCEFNFKEYANFEVRSINELRTSFSAFTIGEAATATILSDEGPRNSIYISFKTWGEKHALCKIPLPNVAEFSNNGCGGGNPMRFFTAPTELLSFTIRELVAHVRESNLLSHYEHNLVIGHTVSTAVSSAIARELELDSSRVFETHGRFGNTVSASLPLALSVAEVEGRLRRGMRVLLLMGSAGVSTAVCSFVY
jgi:3-oxoacyl-[acyl-carrier-protein] synthase III